MSAFNSPDGMPSFPPSKATSASKREYTPLAPDDALAAKYIPKFESSEHGDPYRCFYRMAKNSAGDIHIAYFFVWHKEEYKVPGTKNQLLGKLYSKLVKPALYGREDIEPVVVVIGADEKVKIRYFETNQNEREGKLKQPHVKAFRLPEGDDKNFTLKPVTWNHLLTDVKNPSSALISLTPEFFSARDWKKYHMEKEFWGQCIGRKHRSSPDFVKVKYPPKPQSST